MSGLDPGGGHEVMRLDVLPRSGLKCRFLMAPDFWPGPTHRDLSMRIAVHRSRVPLGALRVPKFLSRGPRASVRSPNVNGVGWRQERDPEPRLPSYRVFDCYSWVKAT